MILSYNQIIEYGGYFMKGARSILLLFTYKCKRVLTVSIFSMLSACLVSYFAVAIFLFLKVEKSENRSKNLEERLAVLNEESSLYKAGMASKEKEIEDFKNNLVLVLAKKAKENKYSTHSVKLYKKLEGNVKDSSLSELLDVIYYASDNNYNAKYMLDTMTNFKKENFGNYKTLFPIEFPLVTVGGGPESKANFFGTSGYGKRIAPIGPYGGQLRIHNANDIAPIDRLNRDLNGNVNIDFEVHNSEVVAIADGIVMYSAYDPVYGYNIEIRHEINDGNKKHFGKEIIFWSSFYAHLSSLPALKKGEKITAGEFLARMGSTGQSTGPHLHFATYRYDKKYKQTPFNIFYK